MLILDKEKPVETAIQKFRQRLLEEMCFKQGLCGLIFLDLTARIRKVGATELHSFLIIIVYLIHNNLQSLANIWKEKHWSGSKNCVTTII
jgi:hypothetical protein